MYLKEIHYSGRVLRLPKKWLLVMKLTTLLLFLSIMTVSASSTLAQKVSANFKNASLESVLNTLKKQTGFDFVYDETLVQNKTVNAKISQLTLTDALDQILGDAGLAYAISDKVVTIKAKTPTLIDKLKSDLGLDKIDLHGKVLADDGLPLSGATVIVKGTHNSTITDNKGEFTLHNVDPSGTITISFIGYEKQDLKADKDLGNIKMKVASNPLDAVQVIAYGETTERLSTGDVTTIKAKDIENSPVTNVLQAVEGRVPGVIITQFSGMPGGSMQIQIQGKNSIQNGNDPLFVIDGVPFTTGVSYNSGVAINGPIGYGNGDLLNLINPNDIESISFLKDGDATAIYGSRAANGAVLITTKKGKAGESHVNVSAYEGIERAPLNITWMNTPQYLQMRHQALNNDGVTPDQYSAPDLTVWDTTRYTNWQKELISGTAHVHDLQAGVSGGSENIQYRIGASYHDETNVFSVPGLNDRVVVDFSLSGENVNKRFHYTFTGNYSVSEYNLPGTDMTRYINMPPDYPDPRNPDGTLNWANGTLVDGNPYAILLTKFHSEADNLIGSSVLSYTIVHGLDLKANLGYSKTYINGYNTNPIAAQYPGYNPTGSSTFGTSTNSSWTIEPQLTYQAIFGASHIHGLLGATFQHNNNNVLTVNGANYTSDALLENLQAAPYVTASFAGNSIYKYNSLFGRANYDYNEEYLIDLNWNRDGSSRFGQDNRFHDFYSIGAGWIITKEKFSQDNLSFLSFGKLRVSYGTSGSDQIGDYNYLSLYGSNGTNYQGQSVLYPSSLSNPDLQWEETRKWNGGIDLGFFKDRLTFSLDYFYNRSSNQLLAEPLPSFTGFTTVLENFQATVRNSGIEISLSTINIKSSDFSWTSAFNLTAPKNALVAFPGLANSVYANRLKIGKSINSLPLYNYSGVDPKTGLYEFSSKTNPFSPIYPNDQEDWVDPSPKFYGGLQNTFTYKNWSLNLLFSFRKQLGLNPSLAYPIAPGVYVNQPASLVGNVWAAPGDHAKYEQYTESYFSQANTSYQFAQQSNLSLVDASFIRLNNVALSYSLPKNLADKLHVFNLQLTVEAQNVFTFTGYKGVDPESPGAYNELPPLRALSAKISFSF